MNKSWDSEYKKMWEERYKETEFVYGKEPNVFFEKWIKKLKPGSVLMPADGEGRNGVFAAKLGWEVTSFDLSEEGKLKTLELAKENQVSVKYIVGDLDELQFEKESFDGMGLIYAHFAPEKKAALHKKLDQFIKPGGIIIFEAFGKKHLDFNEIDPKVGGPRDLHMLFSTAEIKSDFENYDILLLEEKEISLKEGKYHIGRGSVIRFVGRKK